MTWQRGQEFSNRGAAGKPYYALFVICIAIASCTNAGRVTMCEDVQKKKKYM